MVEGYRIEAGGLVPCHEDQACVWLCISPDTAERRHLQARLGIAAHALEASLDPDEVARIEIKPDHLFLVWKRPERFDGRGFTVASVGVMLSEQRLVVICASDSWLGGLRGGQGLASPLDVLMMTLDESVHHYLGHLRVVKQVAREIQQQFTQAMDSAQLVQMYNLRESLVYYVDAIKNNGGVLALLRSHGQRHGFSARQLEALDDLIIENEQSYQQAKIHARVFNNLIEARGNLANNSMNQALRNLTLINVVFLPLNLIASIGGMSEFSMMTASLPWWVSFPTLVLGMVVLAVGMVVGLKRLV